MKYCLPILTLCCAVLAAAEPPTWRPIPLPAIARGLIERQESGPFVLSDAEWFNWCPSVLLAPDGRYHMFHSCWRKSIGFNAWLAMSEIVHRVADRPEGPFRFADVALQGTGRDTWDKYGPRNPEILYFEGKCVLLYIANPDYRRPPHPLNQSIGMAIAASQNGPWTKVGKDGMALTASPDPAHFTHGRQIVNPTLLRIKERYLLYFKTSSPIPGRTVYGVATSDRLEGPFLMLTRPVSSEGVTIEDATAFEWAGRICLLTTDNHVAVTGIRGGGALWVSDDGLTFKPEWTQLGSFRIPAYYAAYNPDRVTKVYGSDPKSERPKVLMIDGKPAYLYATSGWNVVAGKRTVSYVLKFDLQPGDGPLPK